MARTRVSASPQQKKSSSNGSKPKLTQDQIALRAYHIYLERGCTPGDPLDDWVRAERELTETSIKPRRKPAPKSVAA
jgi:hypothetical protein